MNIGTRYSSQFPFVTLSVMFLVTKEQVEDYPPDDMQSTWAEKVLHTFGQLSQVDVDRVSRGSHSFATIASRIDKLAPPSAKKIKTYLEIMGFFWAF